MFRRLMAMILACSAFSTPSAASAANVSDTELDGVGLILIDGDITSDDVEKFRQISIKYRDAFVTLNSDGGALLPAIEIGKIIKVTGYDTVVPGGAVCASSCALIWTAGATRWLSPDGQVGFHASYRDNNGRLEESGVANALVGNYLTLLNLPSNAIVFATSAPPDRILWLTKENKISAGIGFEDFILDDEESAEEAPVAQVSSPAIYTVPRSQEPEPRPRAPDDRQSTNLSRPVRPLTTPARWVSWEDFPSKALGASYENLSPDVSLYVGFSVDVDSFGRVLHCRVTASSGLPALDDATCRAVAKRAVFIPATNASGKAVVSRYVSGAVWKKP